jgi:hypothetical protein
MNRDTQDVLFSWDEGKTWKTLNISQHPIEITNIIIEPESISQEFVVYGIETMEERFGYDLDMEDEDFDDTGIVITMDFSTLHEPQCQGVENAGQSNSDFEQWTPFDGRHGQDKCFMGAKTTYIRRKRDALCYNGEDLEREVKRQICSCTEMDYECDAGYMRSEETNACIKIEGKDEITHLNF